jgi:hypothetical protein
MLCNNQDSNNNLEAETFSGSPEDDHLCKTQICELTMSEEWRSSKSTTSVRCLFVQRLWLSISCSSFTAQSSYLVNEHGSFLFEPMLVLSIIFDDQKTKWTCCRLHAKLGRDFIGRRNCKLFCPWWNYRELTLTVRRHAHRTWFFALASFILECHCPHSWSRQSTGHRMFLLWKRLNNNTTAANPVWFFKKPSKLWAILGSLMSSISKAECQASCSHDDCLQVYHRCQVIHLQSYKPSWVSIRSFVT